ncbi:hypothetical protein MMC30_001389 [Trapelia coarctata]|nr:hypothetical protein [Trapelia coarctata]
MLGALAEGLGYVGRAMLHYNPYSTIGFEIQICCLIMAPALIAAGIYVTLKHIVLALGQQYSYIKASYYPWIFYTMDLLCLLLQGVGGGIAATAKTNVTQLTLGSNLMMAGIVWQVVNLLIFGGVVGQFARDVYVNRRDLSDSARALTRDTRFRLFLAAVSTATVAVFIRCVYRIAEMAGGWANPIMRNEPEFMVLDGGMCIIAVLVLTVFHPGYFFPQMVGQGQKGGAKETGYSTPDIEAPREK